MSSRSSPETGTVGIRQNSCVHFVVCECSVIAETHEMTSCSKLLNSLLIFPKKIFFLYYETFYCL